MTKNLQDGSLLVEINKNPSSPDEEIIFPEGWCNEVEESTDLESNESED